MDGGRIHWRGRDLGGVAEGGGNLFPDPHDAMNEGISELSFIIRYPKEKIIFGESICPF